MKKLYFSLIILCLSALTQQGFAQSAPTVYSTPGAYTYTVGTGVSLIGVDVRGAQGGNGSWSNGTGGTGGRVQANIAVSPGQVLYLYVGSQPAASACGSGGAAGSSFGGGEDGGLGSSYYGQCGGAGGGGDMARAHALCAVGDAGLPAAAATLADCKQFYSLSFTTRFAPRARRDCPLPRRGCTRARARARAHTHTHTWAVTREWRRGRGQAEGHSDRNLTKWSNI